MNNLGIQGSVVPLRTPMPGPMPPPAHQGPRPPLPPGPIVVPAHGRSSGIPRTPGPSGPLHPALGLPVPGTFAPFVRSMMMERFRSPGFAAMLAANRMTLPNMGMPTSGAGFPQIGDSRMVFPNTFMTPFPGFMFTQEDLDMVLYGYARNKVNEQLPGHALSGLRTGELSYGMDRILSGCPTTSKHHLGPVDPASVEVPEGLELFQTTFAGAVHHGIFCKKSVIPKGTRFGPFLGKVVNTSEIKSNDDNSLMWEIFHEGKLSHFIDGRGAAGNWLSFVNCARYAQEQNLLAVQTDNQIFYEACKDIPQGTELLVWYGDCYLQFMGIPVALKEMGNPTVPEDINDEGYQCDRCGKVFAYKYYRDKHLKYTRCVDMGDRKFPCHLCTRSFEKRDRLRIHILHVHEKHRPHKCNVCGKSFSQSSSLNKHMRVHSGERPYKCVYCSKAFTASSILRTHIRQHSGEKPFKCKHCGKAFASHAAHDSHVRRTHTKERPSMCTVCGKSYSQAYELKFHMKTHEMNSINLSRKSPYSSSRFGDINMNEKVSEEPIDVVGMDKEPINMSMPINT